MRKAMGFKGFRQLNTALLASVLVAVFCASVFAQQATNKNSKAGDKVIQVFSREIGGEVGGIDKTSIAIDYGQTDKEALEMALPMDKDTRGSHKKLSEIKIGDIVNVAYEETIEIDKGQPPRVVKRVAKVVEFRQAAKVQSETGALESQGE